MPPRIEFIPGEPDGNKAVSIREHHDARMSWRIFDQSGALMGQAKSPRGAVVVAYTARVLVRSFERLCLDLLNVQVEYFGDQMYIGEIVAGHEQVMMR